MAGPVLPPSEGPATVASRQRLVDFRPHPDEQGIAHRVGNVIAVTEHITIIRLYFIKEVQSTKNNSW
jgi:hypothetical protein